MKSGNIFYNASFNYGSSDGQSKFTWGIGSFDLNKCLISQVIERVEDVEIDKVFNFNLTSFNKIE